MSAALNKIKIYFYVLYRFVFRSLCSTYRICELKLSTKSNICLSSVFLVPELKWLPFYFRFFLRYLKAFEDFFSSFVLMFCSLTYQPNTLNLNHCRIWVSSSQDTQTQQFPPLVCLISVESQAYDSNSIQKKVSYNRPPEKLLLIIDSYVIFGVYFIWKTTVAVRISSKDTNTTLHNSTTFFKRYMPPTSIWHFPFSFGQIDFCTVCT